MKTQINKKFHPEHVKNWQKAAKKQTSGNLTKWMEQELNKAAEKELKIKPK